MVPLCGKSSDMIWMARQGCEILGVELSSLACEDFFKENGLDFKRENANPFVKYSVNNITILCGNFFDLQPEMVSGVSSVYDRAALIALPPELRSKYVQHLLKVTGRPFDALLITIEYDQNKAEGPPFSVSENELRTLYSEGSITVLRSEADGSLSARPKFAGVNILENVYLISIKT